MVQPPLVPVAWELPEDFRRRLGSTVGRQRAMHDEGHLLLVLHLVPEASEDTRRGVLFHRNTSGAWKASNGDHGAVALQNHLDRYTMKLDEFDQLEQQAQQADQYLKLLEGLSPITRAARHQMDALDEARKLLPDERALIDLRDRAYEISRRADLLYDEAKNSMEVAVVRRAEEQASASHQMLVTAHRLNVMVALCFPFATLGAVFGTTLTDNWSWRETVEAFSVFLLVGAATGAILAILISRPTKPTSP